MHVFYTPDIAGKQYSLDEQESKHCVQVLRMSVGDQVTLLDGKGSKYLAQITTANKRKVELRIEEQTQAAPRPFAVHIAVAPTKNIDRLEWFLEKATEVGLDICTPLICDRSERKIIKHDRLNKVITAAVKQSMAGYHPHLNELVDFRTFIKQGDLPAQKFIAHCVGSEKEYLDQIVKQGDDCVILIGPEGDFTSEEIAAALEFGFKPITLGTMRLRTETAALAACFEVNFINR